MAPSSPGTLSTQLAASIVLPLPFQAIEWPLFEPTSGKFMV